MTIPRRAAFCAATAISLWALSVPAQAQIAASVAVESDFRLRGVSMSDRRPAVSFSLADDFKNGVYAGGTAIAQDDGHGGAVSLGHMEYVGYAHRNAGGLGWDVGADNQDLMIHTVKAVRLRYSEAYFGLSSDGLSGRISYSPNYLRPGLSVAYAEVNEVFRPADNWRLSGHAGVFRPLAGTDGTTVRRTRYDARLDLVRAFGPAELDLAWTRATPAALPEPYRSKGGLLVGLTISF